MATAMNWNRNRSQEALRAELLDRKAVADATRALRRLYGEPCPDFDPDCKCCQVNLLVKEINEIFEDEPMKEKVVLYRVPFNNN